MNTTQSLEESESILESVSPMFKNRQLNWHYRSRHESLIAFSNKHFYDNKLILFPSPFGQSEEFGIRFHQVKNGRFIDGLNVEEAKQVVIAAADQLIKHPNESVGVVAMNSKQSGMIDKQLERLIRSNPALQAAHKQNKATNEPIFIKNLESVQGDERDVIIISLTYGPEKAGGKTPQRFGPINTAVGWRRLNVLFTRSKKRMYIFSTMGSGNIVAAENSKKGIKSLKAFLEYCETGHLHNTEYTGKPADSDFEIAVRDALEKHGYPCVVQLGVAGYFLDIAVKDPGQPGRYLIAIECDGATYHSAKSARDRDRLRQDILESLGWKIYRIWSTDWFKNPTAQLNPILNELEHLKTPIVTKVTTIDPVKGAYQYTDDIANIDTSNGQPDKTNIATTTSSKLHLKKRLQHFNATVIITEQPNTDDEKRLLRPAMQEAILRYLPCSKAEFLKVIPFNLRDETAKEEGCYLDQVLKLVADYKES